MKKRLAICVTAIMGIFLLSFSTHLEGEGLQIQGKRFVKNNQPVYFIVDFEGTHLDVCNAQFVGKGANQWTGWNGSVNPAFMKQFQAQLNNLKKKNKMAVIQLFSALYFRGSSADGRGTGVENTVWKAADGQTPWQRFTCDTGVKMQRELIDYVITAAQQTGVDFTFSLMWEAQVAAGKLEFLPWFKAHKDYVNKKYKIPVGMHTYNKTEIAAADFVVDEGNYAGYLGLFELNKPVIILARNPGKFSAGNKCKTYTSIGTWQQVFGELKTEMTREFQDLGSTGYPYPRWTDAATMAGELKKCSDSIKEKMSKWNFGGFAGQVNTLCTQLLNNK